MNDIVSFIYTNHKGETALRLVRPIRIWFGSTAWHREAQWLLEAFDLVKMATRDFAMSGIRDWAISSAALKGTNHDLGTNEGRVQRT